MTGEIRWFSDASMCLDVTDGQDRNGVLIQLWTCGQAGASRSQQFQWGGSDGKIRWAGNPSLCLDVKDHANHNGNRLQLWLCEDWNTDQMWTFGSAPSGKSSMGKSSIRWTNHFEKCVDVRDHRAVNGNPVQIWDCAVLGSNQYFNLLASLSTQTSSQPSHCERYAADFCSQQVKGCHQEEVAVQCCMQQDHKTQEECCQAASPWVQESAVCQATCEAKARASCGSESTVCQAAEWVGCCMAGGGDRRDCCSWLPGALQGAGAPICELSCEERANSACEGHCSGEYCFICEGSERLQCCMGQGFSKEVCCDRLPSILRSKVTSC